MSQNVVNYGIDPSGAQLLDELLSGEQQNRLTMDGGNSRPPYAEIGTVWTDKSVTGKATLKRFNGTSDDILMTIDETTGAITIPGIADADLSNLSASGNSKFQEPLVSGTNIKTINGDSVLGSGNITISAGANTDLSNLSTTGEAHFANPALTNSPYTTNRILEIPQDIKLEINSSNQLVLKAGSKVYFPNGFESDGTTPHFDVVTIESDIVNNNSHNGYHENFLLNRDSTYIVTVTDKNQFSGPTQPTGFGTYAIWYDTANNLIKNTGDGGSTWISGLSLPVCRALGGTSNSVTLIDQVFNGFGYIASTAFILPMKGEATTAVNQNGTVTKTIWESTTVQTANVSASGEYSMSSSGVLTAGFNEVGYTKLADVTYYDSRIQNVNFYDVGFVANTNASNLSKAGRSYLAGIGMPTTKYEELTLGASGSIYIAPANGYFVLVKQASAVGQYAMIYRAGNLIYSRPGAAASASTWFGLWVPARKGDRITVAYTLGGSTQAFNFIYAEGEN